MWRPISIAKKDWALKPRVALALSGGGFRASLFHLGVLKRLAEVNLLSRVEVVSTVSGGSIFGAFLVLRWQRWLEAGGDAAALESIIIQPFRGCLPTITFCFAGSLGVGNGRFSKLAIEPSRGPKLRLMYWARFFLREQPVINCRMCRCW
jgi:hypothetical protein